MSPPSPHQRGVAVVEFALVLPIMLVLLFGVIELGRAVITRQILINVSREASNLASRGTPLEDSISAVLTSAQPLDLAAKGYVIVSEVYRDASNNLRIQKQRAAGGEPQGSRVGSTGGAASLPPTPTQIPPQGFNLYVTEVFYHSEPITPLGSLVNEAIGEIFYDSAYF